MSREKEKKTKDWKGHKALGTVQRNKCGHTYECHWIMGPARPQQRQLPSQDCHTGSTNMGQSGETGQGMSQ